MKLSEDYAPRPIRFLEFWEISGWQLKVYSIVYGEAPLDVGLVRAARRVAEHRLSASAETTSHYGVGFVGIHQGKTGNFVFVDWWADDNELHHHVYVSSSDCPDELEYMTPTGLAACVWDLFLIGHERDAWVTNMLKKASAPDIQAYLAAQLNKDV